jgi:hypothetical protein
MTQAGRDGLAGRRLSGAPWRIHLVTDADCGYTLEEIRAVPGSHILYAELHQRPTDDRRQRSLPAIAVMRSTDELPAVGQAFTPEILTEAVRGTTALSTGRVEMVWEEPPSLLIDEELRERVDDLLSGRVSPSDCLDLRATLATAVSALVPRVERRRRRGRERRPDWETLVDDDLAGVPAEWIEDLAAVRQALDEIDAALATNDTHRRISREDE